MEGAGCKLSKEFFSQISSRFFHCICRFCMFLYVLFFPLQSRQRWQRQAYPTGKIPHPRPPALLHKWSVDWSSQEPNLKAGNARIATGNEANRFQLSWLDRVWQKMTYSFCTVSKRWSEDWLYWFVTLGIQEFKEFSWRSAGVIFLQENSRGWASRCLAASWRRGWRPGRHGNYTQQSPITRGVCVRFPQPCVWLVLQGFSIVLAWLYPVFMFSSGKS